MEVVDSNIADKELIKLVLEDSGNFRELVLRYEKPLDRYIHRLGIRNKEDREDVLQDIFVKVYKNLNSYDNAFTFSAWIYRIAHNESISWYRKLKVRPEGNLVNDEDELLLRQIVSQENSADKEFDESVNAEEIMRALYELDEKYRDPIILQYFENKEYDEISDILKIPIGTVGTLIHRGKKKLGRLLDEHKLHI